MNINNFFFFVRSFGRPSVLVSGHWWLVAALVPHFRSIQRRCSVSVCFVLLRAPMFNLFVPRGKTHEPVGQGGFSTIPHPQQFVTLINVILLFSQLCFIRDKLIVRKMWKATRTKSDSERVNEWDGTNHNLIYADVDDTELAYFAGAFVRCSLMVHRVVVAVAWSDCDVGNDGPTDGQIY